MLGNIRVVDMTTVMMGPYATLQLAELGADVIKVESPDGDSMRVVGRSNTPGMGPLFLHANRNKRSISIDAKTKEGLAIISKLIASADVFMSNLRTSALERLGLGYAAVSAMNPRLVYAVANGFGSGGPYSGRPAYDDLIQSLSSIPSLEARAAGDGNPRYAPIVLADRVSGLALAAAVLAGLVARSKTSQGSFVEVPMFETVAHMVLGDHLGGLSFQPPLGGSGYERLLARHRHPYRTSDGHISAVIYTDDHWRAFLSIIGQAELFERDDRFSSLANRTESIGYVYEFVARELAKRGSAEWLSVLERADVPAAALHTPESLLTDPHLAATDFFETVDHPTEGKLLQMRRPSKWGKEPEVEFRPAPTLGQHTQEVLEQIGFSEVEIKDFITRGIAGDKFRTTSKLTDSSLIDRMQRRNDQ